MSVFLQPLQTVTVGSGGASSISFSSIPQTYTDLFVEASFRDSNGSSFVNTSISFDSSSNYSNTTLSGNGSGTGSGRTSGSTALQPWFANGSGSTSSTFTNATLYIPNYTSSNYKSIISDMVAENNSSTAYQELAAGLYSSTSAISTINFYAASGYVQYSKFSLYGVLRQGI